MSTPTRLQRLSAGLDAIPQKRRRKDLLGLLGRYSELAATGEKLVRDTAEGERCSLAVFPGLAIAPAEESRRRASRVAARVATRLRAAIENVQERDTENDVDQLLIDAKAADKALRERWTRRLEERLKGYGALVKAAEAAKLPGSRVLATQLAVLQARASAPPRAESEAEEIRKAVAGLAGLVGELGLEGAAGKFLVAAAANQGDARALCDPEVRDFVERHDLWRLLVVTLR
jgi:hypothetical protein